MGLPKELGLHCLRHSYITHLIEAGYDPAFVQTQAGHSHASVTSVYTSVGEDFKQTAAADAGRANSQCSSINYSPTLTPA